VVWPIAMRERVVLISIPSCTAAIGDELTQRQCDGGAVIGARRAVDVVPPRAAG